MTDLVVTLLAWVVLLSGAPTPATLPTVVRLPHAQLEAMACARPCAVLGLYTYDSTVYLDDRLDPEADLYARSILLHELVHWLQQTSGRYEGLSLCESAVTREREAYAAQNAYLLRHGALPRAGSTLHGMQCAGTPLQAAAPAPAFVYDATVVRVVDGDTLVADVTLPLVHVHGVTVRLLGVDAPELHDADPARKAAAAAAKAFVEAAGLHQAVRLELRGLPGWAGISRDSFGRWLARVWYRTADGLWHDLSAELLTAGLAVPF